MPDLIAAMMLTLMARPLRPAALITVTIGGRTFKCSRRTAAHLLWTIARLKALHPQARLEVIQGCYNIGVDASAGTHDLDACLDVRIAGLGWWEAQDFLRACGWAAWVRQPPAFSWHIHMVSIGYPGPVGVYVPGQVDDYYRHTFGLKGQHNTDLDKTWFPGDVGINPPVGTPTEWRTAINKTVFDYPAWVRDQEDNMPISDDDLKKVEAAAKAGTLAALNEGVIDVGKGRKWSVVTVLSNLRTLVKGS